MIKESVMMLGIISIFGFCLAWLKNKVHHNTEHKDCSIRPIQNNDWKTHINCFRLGDKEVIKYAEWNKKHLEECHEGKEPYSGAAGGRISFTFTRTGLGTGVSVMCNLSKCRENKCNITDYEDW